MDHIASRRAFLRRTTLIGTGLLLTRDVLAASETQPATPATTATAATTTTPATTQAAQEEEVSPAEDLMREHGMLRRVLLIYRECMRRLDGEDANGLKLQIVSDSAKIVRSFVEDYHEKLEEEHLFPQFRKSNTLVQMVGTLVQQHQAGRRLTDSILGYTDGKTTLEREARRQLKDALGQFIRMYEPHAAREDTELFPAMHQVFSEREYKELGEEFEKREKQLFGENGFEKTVTLVANLEKTLGINELAQFTPSA